MAKASSQYSDFDPKFRFAADDLKSLEQDWTQKGYPLEFLHNDHLGAKIFRDNKLFEAIRGVEHSWKWEEGKGLLINYKKSATAAVEMTPWSEIFPNLSLRRSIKGEYLLYCTFYNKLGLLHQKNFQFTSDEMAFHKKRWAEGDWPLKFLERDQWGAKILYDNQVFLLMKMFNQPWKWDDKKGLAIPFRKTVDSKTDFAFWEDVSQLVPLIYTAQGWLLFDGWNYIHEGLVPRHLWEWPKMYASYRFPEKENPKEFFVDIVSFNWEHEGLQGFGIRTPHGHIAVELCDDEGNVTSVGQYMDPRARLNIKTAPAANVRAALLSPDPYFPSLGDKTIHRISFGKGKEGKSKYGDLVRYIEAVQNYTVDKETGVVVTCPGRIYHMFDYNCGDFVDEVESYSLHQLGGKLVKLDETSAMLPGRKVVPKYKEHAVREFWTFVTNWLLLVFVDFMIYLILAAPFSFFKEKLGAGKKDDLLDVNTKYDNKHSAPKPANKHLFSFMGMTMRQPKSVRFPVKFRLEQLYGSRRNYSVKTT